MANNLNVVISSVVLDYLTKIDKNLAQRFKKHTKALTLAKGSPAIHDIFKYFIKTNISSRKIKLNAIDFDDTSGEENVKNKSLTVKDIQNEKADDAERESPLKVHTTEAKETENDEDTSSEEEINTFLTKTNDLNASVSSNSKEIATDEDSDDDEDSDEEDSDIDDAEEVKNDLPEERSSHNNVDEEVTDDDSSDDSENEFPQAEDGTKKRKLNDEENNSPTQRGERGGFRGRGEGSWRGQGGGFRGQRGGGFRGNRGGDFRGNRGGGFRGNRGGGFRGNRGGGGFRGGRGDRGGGFRGGRGDRGGGFRGDRGGGFRGDRGGGGFRGRGGFNNGGANDSPQPKRTKFDD